MKKIILPIIFIICLIVSGCGKNKGELNNFLKKVNNINSYYLTGTLEIVNNEDIFTYNIKVSYKDKDYYKVNMINKTNDHEQIILKNKEGVYVLTPSLNKSFKFQSEWPYNNSQSYLLQSIASDIKNDKKKKVKKNGKYTIIMTNTNYKNNPKLKNQKIYLEDGMVKKVEVFDKDGNIKIKMKFKSIDLNPKFNKNYFNVKTNLSSKLEKTSKQLNDIVYPMNMPKNTYLSSEDKINTKDGERAILTFAGEKPFTLVEETVNVSKELETINIIGEPDILIDTVGALSDNSINWISNGVEYYATSETMKESELLEVVKSINNIPISK